MVDASNVAYFASPSPCPSPPADLDPPHLRSWARVRERALVLTAAIRVIAVTVFLGIGIAWTFTRGMSPWILAWPLAAYLALATLAFVYRRRALTMRLSWVLPFLDIGVAFLVHRLGSPPTKACRASWRLGVTGLGVYTLIVALAGFPCRALGRRA
jgi:hypothetical protein